MYSIAQLGNSVIVKQGNRETGTVPRSRKQRDMPKKKADPSSAYIRVTGLVPNELATRVDEVRARLRSLGVRVSNSAVIEVALLELLGRRDLADVLRKHGARARRD